MTNTVEDAALAEAFLAYAANCLPDLKATGVARLTRIHGGASRATYALDLDTAAGPRGLILRLDQAASLIDTERAVEFDAYRSVFGQGVPVPEALALEPDAGPLGAAFFVMERIEGGEAISPFNPEAYGANDARVGEQFFTILGRIHRIDPAATALAARMERPAADTCWRRELDHWESVIAADALSPMPVAQATTRWLRANPPPPAARVSLIHGDYRAGNFLTGEDGTILAILDWEMAHFGDPLEDLAWALDPMWSHLRPGTGAGMVDRDRAIALWEAASGLSFDARAFEWWETFASFKGLAIWTSAAKAYASLANMDPVNAFSGWWCTAEHERRLARLLCERAGVEAAEPEPPPMPAMPPPFTPETILGLSAMRIGERVAPALETAAPYAHGDVATIALLGIFAAQRFEREADDLLQDIAAAHAALPEAIDALAPTLDRLDAQSVLDSFDQPQSRRLSALRAARDDLFARISETLGALSKVSGKRARKAEGALFRLLSASAERRAMVLPPPSA